MSIEQHRTCAVFGTTKNVERFRIKIERLEENDDPDRPGKEVLGLFRDLGMRALKRLQKLILRGVNPIGWDESEPAAEAKEQT